MRGFDRDHVSQDMVNRCIADLTLEKYTHARSADWYEKLAEVHKKNIEAADDELKATKEELAKADAELQTAKEELANVKKQLDSANKKIENLTASKNALFITADKLTTENKQLKEAVATLKALPPEFHVSNIVTEFRPSKPVRTKVYWGDGKATMVTLAVGDIADPYTAFCAALAKKVFGSTPKVRKLVEDKRTIVCFDEAKEGDIDA